jgi:hypothetical protein
MVRGHEEGGKSNEGNGVQEAAAIREGGVDEFDRV